MMSENAVIGFRSDDGHIWIGDFKMNHVINYIMIDENANQPLALYLLETDFSDTALAACLDNEGNLISGIQIGADGKSFEALDLPSPNESTEYAQSNISMYNLKGVTVFVQSGIDDALSIWPADAQMEDYFENWDFGDVDPATARAELGLDPRLEDAKDFDTDVRIWQSYDYFSGTINAPSDDFLRNASNEIMYFSTYIEAKKWIEDSTVDVYYLEHGEAGPVRYSIVT